MLSSAQVALNSFEQANSLSYAELGGVRANGFNPL
jgi:hypothetical protein